MISKNLGSSRKFQAVNAKCGKLGDFAQALFPLIVVNADDFGRLDSDAFTVKHKVFPVSPRTEEDFETVLQAMSAVGLIRFYESGGDRYLEIVNFDREQPGLHKRTKSDYPDPPDDFGKFPEEQNLTEQTRNATSADAALSRTPEALVELYKAENKKLPKVLEFGLDRRDKCKSRLATDPQKFIDQFTRAVIKAQETPFLCGEGE